MTPFFLDTVYMVISLIPSLTDWLIDRILYLSIGESYYQYELTVVVWLTQDESDDDMNSDDTDEKTLSVLDPELEAAVRQIEQDPVINPYHYTFTINNDQLCTDSIHGGLAPGL